MVGGSDPKERLGFRGLSSSVMKRWSFVYAMVADNPFIFTMIANVE